MELLLTAKSSPVDDLFIFLHQNRYATADGQFREETGMLMNPGTPEEELVVMGMYGYETDDGTEVMVMYVSGKSGYRAKTKLRKLAESERKKKLFASLVG